MKTFQISNGDPGDTAALDTETLRALQSITSKRGTGGERETCDEAMTENTLSCDQVETIRRLETEFAREIAEFKASRRPLAILSKMTPLPEHLRGSELGSRVPSAVSLGNVPDVERREPAPLPSDG